MRPRGLWGLTGRSRSVTPSGDDQTGLDPAQKSGDSSAEARGTEAPSSSGRSDSDGAASVTMEDVTATLQVSPLSWRIQAQSDTLSLNLLWGCYDAIKPNMA